MTNRLMTIDDVVTDKELRAYFRTYAKALAYHARELAMAAGTLGAMLRIHDQRASRKRAGQIVRPIALASVLMFAAARYLKLACRRFETQYAPELQAAGRRKKRSGRRELKFGD
ncbi:hypothetical protein GCM10010124_26350 [Pilimelia terevasa]|uniref:Uncharacterized protein n=1 Tax=Pilimelia terevasa TaxID=53372 RepID=A0A8J3BM46_9ACTN|nr:hypothetical protein [Pilimelia terevasa]GGK32300.1 hypothetical protein GCM10010124_26350 [Pilimelia terevasa]